MVDSMPSILGNSISVIYSGSKRVGGNNDNIYEKITYVPLNQSH